MTAAAISERSPRAMARLAGVLLFLTMVLGALGQARQGAVLVPGDAAATAARIQAEGGLLWTAFALYLIELSCQFGFTVVCYELFRPVSRTGSALAAGFGAVGVVVKIVSRLCLLVPPLLLSNRAWLEGVAAGERAVLALLALEVNLQGAGVATVFFGLSAVITGYLTVRSTFLPAWLGVLGMIAGAGWLAFVHPPFGLRWSGVVIAAGALGALVKVAWYTIAGVREEAWKDSARRAQGALWT